MFAETYIRVYTAKKETAQLVRSVCVHCTLGSGCTHLYQVLVHAMFWSLFVVMVTGCCVVAKETSNTKSYSMLSSNGPIMLYSCEVKATIGLAMHLILRGIPAYALTGLHQSRSIPPFVY